MLYRNVCIVHKANLMCKQCTQMKNNVHGSLDEGANAQRQGSFMSLSFFTYSVIILCSQFMFREPSRT